MADSTGFLNVNGGKLYYEVTGQGFPLVLIHSRWMHSDLWDEQVKVFAPHYQIIRYDVRGFGRSEMVLIPYDDGNDLRQLFDHLNISQAHLLGLSMGAEIAINFALNFPERVRSLIVSGAGLEEYEWSERFNQAWGTFAAAIQRDDYPGAINQIVQMWVDGPMRPASEPVRSRTRFLMLGHTFVHHKPFPLPAENEISSEKSVQSAPPISEREKFSRLNLPVLVMVGSEDWPEMVAMAGILAEDYLSNARLVILPDAAHITSLEQPEKFNDAVLSFLKEQAGL